MHSEIVRAARARTANLLALTGLALAFAGTAAAQTSEPLLQQSDLVYQGSFRLPPGSSETTTFQYGGTGLAYNPANNSIYMTGHDWNQLTAEVKIPQLVNSTSLDALNTATLLQSFKDPVEGKLSSINPSDPNSKKIGGHLVYNGKLYVTGYSFYDGAGTQTASHFVRPLNLATSGQVQGPYKVSTLYPGFYSGYMALVPPEWQSALGGPALTGNCCQAITSLQSNGPSVSVFDPTKVGATSPVPATTLVGYPYSNPIADTASKNDYFNLATKIKGVVFPAGTRSVLFFGRQGTGQYCYGTGAECGDLADSSKGTHAYPYVYQIWAYDANDLLAVKKGSKAMYAVRPYALWRLSLPFEDKQGDHLIGGVAYDAASSMIYFSAQCVDTNCGPIIHAYKVKVGALVPTPLPPSNVTVQ